MKTKVYIAINQYLGFGLAEVVSIGEDANVFGVKTSPVFGNGAIPAFSEFSEKEYLKKYEEMYEEYEIVYIRDFKYPEDYKETLKLYEELNNG
jgi:enolase